MNYQWPAPFSSRARAFDDPTSNEKPGEREILRERRPLGVSPREYPAPEDGSTGTRSTLTTRIQDYEIYEQPAQFGKFIMAYLRDRCVDATWRFEDGRRANCGMIH